jgi:hypothetical protein
VTMHQAPPVQSFPLRAVAAPQVAKAPVAGRL